MCDAALPGGHVREDESPVDAALREAWEEAWVHPRGVRVLGSLPPTRTRLGNIVIQPVLAEPRGPLCPMPHSSEVDQVFWLPLSLLRRRREEIVHPARGIRVVGYRLPGGAILWGATLRILDIVVREVGF
jgi:8-oxo-dGTP pyrophosphatase MutT (NUDIX family)